MWKYIEEINWSELSKKKRGYEEGKRYMLENFTLKRSKEINDFVNKCFSKLYKRIEEFEQANDTHCGSYGGDDSFGDMIHHIIGLGEATFNEMMEEPSKLNDIEFVESFSYCMPYEEDYKMLNEDYHVDRAKKAVVELARMVTENSPSGQDVMVIKELMDRFLLLIAGDVHAAMEDYDHDNDYSRLYQFEANDCNARFANYISDCDKYKDILS